jgi:hypothetical protein
MPLSGRAWDTLVNAHDSQHVGNRVRCLAGSLGLTVVRDEVPLEVGPLALLIDLGNLELHELLGTSSNSSIIVKRIG